jgi:hypothetical protein
MESVSSAVTKVVDMLPAYGDKGKVDVFSGWPAKVMLAIAAIETVLALGSWARFGWTLVFELVIVVVGLWMNRNGHETYVWGAVIASIIAGPLARHYTDGGWAMW